MFRFVFVLCLIFALAACAGGPNSYHQAAAYTPVRPPAVRPVVNEPYFPAPGATPTGAGLPGERVPGTVTSSVPRSPNKRILPASSEHGLWAADPVEASGSRERLKLDVLGVELPSARKDGTPAVRLCRDHLVGAIASANLLDDLMSLSVDERRCEVLRLQEDCLSRNPIKGARAREDDSQFEEQERTAKVRQKACEGIDRTKLGGVHQRAQSELKKRLGSFRRVTGYGEEP